MTFDDAVTATLAGLFLVFIVWIIVARIVHEIQVYRVPDEISELRKQVADLSAIMRSMLQDRKCD